MSKSLLVKAVLALSMLATLSACGKDEPGPSNVQCESCSCSSPVDGGSSLPLCESSIYTDCCY